MEKIGKIKKDVKYDIICYIIMSFFALLILLIFSRETSPLFGSAFHRVDSIQYKLAGKMILDGYVPFKDIFHQKGVSFFYIEALGELFCKLFGSDRAGTFFIQYVNFVAIFAFMFSIAKMLLKKVCTKAGLLRGISLTVMIPAMVVYVATFVNGNYTEEYSLLFNLISVWLGIKYINNICEDNPVTYEHKPIYALVHALMFSTAFWIRPNNCIAVCTTVAFIITLLVIKKQFVNLLKNAVFFILGFVGSTLLFFSYYVFNGALSDVIYGQFGVNIGYLSNVTEVKFEFLLPLIVCFVYSLYILVIKKTDFLFALLNAITSACVFLMYVVVGSQFYHYNVFVMVPVFLFTILAFRNISIESVRNIFCINILIPALAFCLTSFIYFEHFYTETYYSVGNIIKIQMGEKEKIADSERIGKELKTIIPKECKKDIYIYPGNIDCYQIYYYSDMYPFCKYPNPVWFGMIKSEKDIEYFYKSLYEDPPSYVVVNESVTEKTDYTERTEEFIEEKCDLWYTGDGYKVYQYKSVQN